MTKIKFCGMRRIEDIQAANKLKPDFIGFVFAPKSRRFIVPEAAANLKTVLDPDITAVGVFVDEPAENVARLLNNGTIDIAQLHGSEDEAYLARLRRFTDKLLVRAFRIHEKADLAAAETCTADGILLDAGSGDGVTFDWELLSGFRRPYTLAGGLNAGNVKDAVLRCRPYAVDVSSGIETNGFKDEAKMAAFIKAVRG